MTASLDIYDPATDTWQSGAPLPRPRGGVNGILALGCFHVWGGEGQGIGEPNDVFPDHDVYDARSDVWVSVADLPTPVHGVTGAAFVDGLIYIPGGGISPRRQQRRYAVPGVSARFDVRGVSSASGAVGRAPRAAREIARRPVRLLSGRGVSSLCTPPLSDPGWRCAP